MKLKIDKVHLVVDIDNVVTEIELMELIDDFPTLWFYDWITEERVIQIADFLTIKLPEHDWQLELSFMKAAFKTKK